MKTKISIITIAVITTITLFNSCKKPADGAVGPQGPQGATGPSYTGNLEGYINHFDVSGQKLLTGLSGDSVYIDGISNVAVTDANGKYSFTGINTGNYNMTINRSGFGTTKLQNIQFLGVGDTYKDAKINKIPTINVTSATAIDTIKSGNHYLKVKGIIPPNASGSTVIMYFSLPGNSSVSSSTTNYSNYITINVAANASGFTNQINVSDFYDLGFTTGNTIYIAYYVVGGNLTASSYQDLTNNKNIFTALSNTPVFNTYILP